MPTSRLGGHLVSGHVDGIGEVKSKSSSGRAIEYWIKAPGSSPATSPRRAPLQWMESASPSMRFRGSVPADHRAPHRPGDHHRPLETRLPGQPRGGPDSPLSGAADDGQARGEQCLYPDPGEAGPVRILVSRFDGKTRFCDPARIETGPRAPSRAQYAVSSRADWLNPQAC